MDERPLSVSFSLPVHGINGIRPRERIRKEKTNSSIIGALHFEGNQQKGIRKSSSGNDA